MPTSPLNMVIRHLLADFAPDGGHMTDGELLARFLSSRDDDALAALVRRHAPMVWGVCGRLLNNRHDAEDAFQATFLVLVRKAAGVPRQAVANWLYGVARQTAVRVRASTAKRGRRETQVVNMPEKTVAQVRDADWQAVLDEELSRLPDHYRGVIVLCDLEGTTRKEAARQLAIPEGSVASRLARARVLLAKRLTQRGVVLSGGSAAAVLSAGSASASAPTTLVASTIKAASLLAAGKAATGVISAKVAAVTDGVVKAMFLNQLKSALTVALVILALGMATFGLGVLADGGPNPQPREANVKVEEPKDPRQPPAQPKQQPSDQERMIGNWFITNDDSGRKGEMWVISEDRILMHAKNLGAIAHQYFHRLDAAKDPKHVDINVTLVNGRDVGVIKGLYALAADELRLCLADMGNDRPAAFAEKPGPGELLILKRKQPGGGQPKAKEEQPAAKPDQKGDEKPAQPKPPPAKTDQERMVGGWVIVKNDGERKRTGELWSIGKHQIVMNANLAGFRTLTHFHGLDAAKNPQQIDITVTTVAGVYGPDVPIKADARIVGVIKGIYAFTDDNELRLCLGDMGKDRPTEFAGKPGQSELLILHGGDPAAWQRKVEKEQLAKKEKEERLRVLIDKALAAHGGEDKLNKLTSFTMTVKHSNGETQHYFVQPPKNFRWETTHPDRTGKRIVILFPDRGRRWWTKEPNEEAKEFIPTGLEFRLETWLDYVKFFGPRQVLRLKDPDHKVALLDEEEKIGGRAAVGVHVTGPHYNQTMYFDKETHLILKSRGVSFREGACSDYKTWGGIPIAQKEDDGYFMPEVTDFRVVEKLDPKLFEQP